MPGRFGGNYRLVTLDDASFKVGDKTVPFGAWRHCDTGVTDRGAAL
jgi:hypothetical protein